MPDPAEGENKTNVTLDTGILADIKNKKVDLYLGSDILDLLFDENAVSWIVDQHHDKNDVSVVVEDKTEPVAEGEKPTSLVFDIHLAVNGEKVDHSDFGESATVTVTIPLDRFGDLTGKMVKVWYLSGDEPEEMEAIIDNNAKKVKFLTHHFSEYAVEVVDVEPETPPVVFVPTFSNGSDNTAVETGTAQNGATTYRFRVGTGNAAPYATVTAPVNGWKLGEENEFTVTSDNDIACVVIVKDADGNYTRLTVVSTDEETKAHSFKATLGKGYEIIVAVKGDANGDGSVGVADRLMIAARLGGTTSFDAMKNLIADVNKDGSVGVSDRLMIAACLGGTTTLQW